MRGARVRADGPIATVPRPGTVDVATGEAVVAAPTSDRDVRAVPAAGIVAEAMVGAVPADVC